MRRLVFFAAFVFSAGATSAIGTTRASGKAEQARMTILHTSDLHGRVSPVDVLADADLGGGLARVATTVREARAEGRPVLLLDSGDTIEGSPEQTLAFASGPDPTDPIVAAMNLAGYDAMAVGNHDFDFGLDRLQQSRRQARFPFLSANTLAPGDREAFAPTAVRVVGGVRIGILGLITTGTPNWVSPSLLDGLRFLQPLAIAKFRVGQLRDEERCDFVVILTHQGFDRDPKTGKERSGASGENQAYTLATQVPGVDLVLAGHAHTLVDPRRVGTGAWVSAPGRWGEALTRFDLVFERDAPDGRWRIADVRGRNLSMKKVVPDPEVAGAVASAHDAAMKILAVKLADLAAPVSTRGARTEDSGIVDWLHRVQLSESKADVSFASLLASQPLDWPKGPLTIRQVWQLYPYENSLVTVRTTGKVVREALERAAACMADTEQSPRSCDSLEGADYEIDLSRPFGHRVVFLRRGGKDVAPEDVLTVALNSHRAAGGGGYVMWKRAQRLGEKGSLRQMLVADARARKQLTLEPTGNWKVVGRQERPRE